MRRTCWTVAAGVLAIVELCAGAEEGRGRPIPAGKEARTQAQFAEAHLKFSLADVEWYRKHTQDPADVRESAAEFIRAVYARNLLSGAKPTWEELSQAALVLSQRGSKDPLILSQGGLVLGNLGRFQDAAKQLTAATAAFKKSDYPARPQYRALDRLLWVLEKRGRVKEMIPLMPEYRDRAVQWIQSAPDRPDDQRFLAYALNNIFRVKAFVKDQEALCEACRDTPGVNPWMREMLLGRYHAALAWYHRGGGFANTVTPEGAAKFEENLRLATRHYTAAWELHHEWSEAAAEMIGVSMGLADAKLSPRAWFDRAVAGEVDYLPAYRSMLWALRPRWGGSHEAMYGFGLECLATRRFDTDVPFQLIQALLDIQSESSNVAAMWQRPDVYQNVKTACEGMEHEPSRADDLRSVNGHSYTMSLQVAAALHAKQYVDARRVLEKLGDRAQSAIFAKLRRRLDDDRPLVFALTGKGGEEVDKALRLLETGNAFDTRLKAYDLLLAARKLDDNPFAQVFFQRKLGPAKWERGFAAGDWIDLTFQPETALWDASKGTWNVVDSRQVVGKSSRPEEGMAYICRAQFPPPLEIEVDVECLNSTQRTLRTGVCVGEWRTDILSTPGAPPTGLLFWADGPRNRSGLARVGELPWSFEQPLAKPCRLHLRVWKDYFEFSCDGRLFPVHHSAGFVPEEPISLGNTHWLQEAGEARFSNLRVRKLTVAVPPPESEDEPRVQYYTEVLRTQPKDTYAHCFRAIAQYRLGKIQQAQADLREAIALRPDVTDVAISRAEELASMHEDFSLARAIFELVLLVRPDDAKAHRALAWFLATCDEPECRNGSVALAHAQRACDLTDRNQWRCLIALAAAQAELGQFDEAVKVMEQVQKSAPSSAQEKVRKMLDQFHARHAYHEPKSKRPA